MIERFGGEVLRFVGNRTLALFRFSDEDPGRHPAAVEAGLALRDDADRFRADLAAESAAVLLTAVSVRVGVHAGEVERFTDEPVSLDSLEPVTSVSMQCLEAADPGQVAVTHDLLNRMPGLFVTKELESSGGGYRFARVSQVSGLRSARELSLAHTATPLISREVELQFLKDRWQRASSGDAQAILIRGEAGIGKSRIVMALRSEIASHRYSWIECQCEPEFRTSPFRPLANFFEQIVGLQRSEPHQAQVERLSATLRTAGFSVEEKLPVFANFLGVELSAEEERVTIGREEMRRETLDWLCEWLVRIAEQQPTAVVIEDLHWADPSTLDLVKRLLELTKAGRLRVLLILIAREEFDPGWVDAECIRLPRFGPKEIVAMASAVAAGRPLSSILAHEVSQKAEGLPLFIEEFTEDVLEAAAQGESGRATVETSMLRRIARISNLEVVRMMAVVGRECSRAVVERVAADLGMSALETEIEILLSAKIVRLRTGLGKGTYVFRHALVRDAIYADLDSAQLKALHGSVARAYEELSESEMNVGSEVIAQHLVRASEPERALTYYQQAAQTATQSSANAEAVLHLRAALELVGKIDEDEEQSLESATTELRLLCALGPLLTTTLGYADPEVAEAYVRAQKLCDRVSDPELLFLALYGLSTFYQARGSRVQSGELAAECLAVAEQAGQSSLLILSHQRLGLSYFYGGDPTSALVHLEKAMGYYDAAKHRPLAYVYGGDMGVISRAYAAAAYFVVGRPEKARQYAHVAIDDAKEGGHKYTIGFALSFSGVVLSMLRDHTDTLAIARESIAHGGEYGFPLWKAVAHLLHGWARAEVDGKAADAVLEIEEGLTLLEQIGSVVGTPIFYALSAAARVRVGSDQHALDALSQSLHYAELTESPFWSAEVLRQQGEILARRGETARARESLEEALALAKKQGARSLELKAAATLERLLRSEGKADEAALVLASSWENFASGLGSLTLSLQRDIMCLTCESGNPRVDEQAALEGLIQRLPTGARDLFQLDPLDPSDPSDPRDRPGEKGDAGESAPGSYTNAELVCALSPRRLEVLHLVAKGLTNREISSVLGIAENTAKAHVAGLLDALSLSNRTEAAVSLREYEAERDKRNGA